MQSIHFKVEGKVGEGKREGEGWRERKQGKGRKLIKRSKRKGRPTGAVENNGFF